MTDQEAQVLKYNLLIYLLISNTSSTTSLLFIHQTEHTVSSTNGTEWGVRYGVYLSECHHDDYFYGRGGRLCIR